MKEYVNRDGVRIHAEFVSEGEHAGLWHTVHEASGTDGYVTDAQFKYNWTLTSEAPAAPASQE